MMLILTTHGFDIPCQSVYQIAADQTAAAKPNKADTMQTNSS